MAGRFDDGTGSIELRWFQGLKWLQSTLQLNQEYILFGKPSEWNGAISVVHPELELAAEVNPALASSLQAIYATTEKLKTRGLDSRGILRLQKQLQIQLPPRFSETLPDNSVQSLRLMNRRDAFAAIHFPDSPEAQRRPSSGSSSKSCFISSSACSA